MTGRQSFISFSFSISVESTGGIVEDNAIKDVLNTLATNNVEVSIFRNGWFNILALIA